MDIKRSLRLFCSLFLCLAFLPMSVGADFGPKPNVTVQVINAPDQLYYLDLLVYEEASEYDNLNGSRNELDPLLLSGLASYEAGGWYPALSYGTGLPLWGNVTGQAENGIMLHSFRYFGVPDSFRIVTACADGTVQATDEVYQKVTFQCTIVYDYAANSITASTPAWLCYVVQFLSTCIPTLLIEGLILLLFRFSLRNNWKVFLSTNIVTQLLLTVSLGSARIFYGTTSYFLFFIPAEIVVILLECGIYAGHLTGHSRGRRTVYAVCANVCSGACGLFTVRQIFSLIFRL